MKLEDKFAIVTAAGRGIGRSIALCLAEGSANVVVNSFQEETTARISAEVEALGRQSLPITGDITEVAIVEGMIQDTLKAFGKIDILVNNVGGGPPT